MQRRRSLTLAAVALVSAVGITLFARSRSLGAGAPVQRIPATELTPARRAAAELVAPGATVANSASEPSTGRRAVERSAPMEIEAAVSGVVLDAEGRALAGVPIWLELANSDSIEGALSRRGRRAPEVPFAAETHWTTTDPSGAFEFAGTHTADGGRLIAVTPGVPSIVVYAAVDPRAERQRLSVPDERDGARQWPAAPVRSN